MSSEQGAPRDLRHISEILAFFCETLRGIPLRLGGEKVGARLQNHPLRCPMKKSPLEIKNHKSFHPNAHTY